MLVSVEYKGTHAPDTHGRVLHGYVNQQHLKTAIRK